MPQIGDFPVCTCDISNICFIHKPSGAPLGSDKVPTSVFVVLDIEECNDSYEYEIVLKEIQSIHKSFENACKMAESLIKENLETFNHSYEHVGSDEDYKSIWISSTGSYIAIQELTLQE